MTEIDFNETWNKIIHSKYMKMYQKFGGLVCLASSKKDVNVYYDETLTYAKNHYMMNTEGRLNRYKVAAAMMIAILKAKPIKKASNKYYTDSTDKWIFNEQLALYTGLMIVRNFILAEIDDKGGPQNSRDAVLLKQFEHSFPLRKKDRERWEIELYFLRQEGTYNLLALAHELEDFVELAVLRAS